VALTGGAGRCPVCLTMVKPLGFFQRLFGGLKFKFSVNTSPRCIENVQTNVYRSQTYQIRDAKTGEAQVFHSLEEMPE
jgi:hypothetical protein